MAVRIENMALEIETLTLEKVASICDHTFLKRPEEFYKKGEDAIDTFKLHFYKFLSESKKIKPYAICVRPEYVDTAKAFLNDYENIDIKIASVAGFPAVNLYPIGLIKAEALSAVEGGASEIDIVFNYFEYRHSPEITSDNIKRIVDSIHEKEALVKLILGTSYLDGEEIKDICHIAEDCNVDFVKTSTGYGSYGAREEDLVIMRENFDGGIKISGEVNKDNYKNLLRAAIGKEFITLDPMKIRIGESSLLKI